MELSTSSENTTSSFNKKKELILNNDILVSRQINIWYAKIFLDDVVNSREASALRSPLQSFQQNPVCFHFFPL